MKRILINAVQPEELRVAFVNGQVLEDLEVEPKTDLPKKGDIYKGVVARVERSLEAAFIDYGHEKHGFLPYKNISSEYLTDPETKQTLAPPEALRRNRTLLVQIQHAERGNKGALLTNRISLAGSAIVLMPNSPNSGGVSRRADDTQRQKARDALSQITCHDNESVILRTSGVESTDGQIADELEALRQLWDNIMRTAAGTDKPLLIYQESGVLIRTLRDKFYDHIKEVIIDDPEAYKEAKDFVNILAPDRVSSIKLHKGSTPLFNEFQIEQQINQAYEREVPLPSGGVLVFDHTEALLSIDINSAKHMRHSGIEDTALSVNLEACDEIARQLCLRDIGGLIVIDFIDMRSDENRHVVEKRLTQAMSFDRARTRIGFISKFGLLELSRQRLHRSLGETSHIPCPHCDGHGVVRTVQSASLSAMRVMEDEAAKDRTVNIYAKLPMQMVEFLFNTKRAEINALEEQYKVNIFLTIDHAMEVPHFKVIRQCANDPKPTAGLRSHAERSSQTPSVWKNARQAASKPAIREAHHAAALNGGSLKERVLSVFRALLPFGGGDDDRASNGAPQRRNEDDRRRGRQQDRRRRQSSDRSQGRRRGGGDGDRQRQGDNFGGRGQRNATQGRRRDAGGRGEQRGRGRDFSRDRDAQGGRERDSNRERGAQGGRDFSREGSAQGGQGRDFSREGSAQGGQGRDFNREGSAQGGQGRNREGSGAQGGQGRDFNRERGAQGGRGRTDRRTQWDQNGVRGRRGSSSPQRDDPGGSTVMPDAYEERNKPAAMPAKDKPPPALDELGKSKLTQMETKKQTEPLE